MSRDPGPTPRSPRTPDTPGVGLVAVSLPVTPMSRRPARRWTGRVGATAGVIGLALLAAYHVALPLYAEHAIAVALGERGYTEARFELRRVSLEGIEIADLRLQPDDAAGGPPAYSIAAVAAEYTLAGLIAGRVDSLRVTGVRWPVRLTAGALDFGPLPQSDTSLADLPFERVELRDVVVDITRDVLAWQLVLSGQVVAREGVVTVALDGEAAGEPARIDGSIAEGEAGLRADAALSLGAGITLEALYRQNGDRPDTARVALRGRRQRLDLTLGGQSVVMSDVSAEAITALHGSQVREADATLTAGAITIGDRRLDDVSMHIGRDEDSVTFQLAGRGDGWRLRRLDGSLPDDLGVWRQQREVPLAWQLEGAVTAPVRRVLAEHGVSLTGTGGASWTLIGRGVLRSEPVLRPLDRIADLERPGSWRLDVTEARVRASARSLDVPGDLRLRGAALDVRARGQVSIDGIDLAVQPGSRLEVTRARHRGGGLRLSRGASVAIVDQPARLRITSPGRFVDRAAGSPADSSIASWQVSAPAMQVRITGLEHRAGRRARPLALTGGRASLALWLHGDPERVAIGTRSASRVRIGELSHGQGEDAIRVHGTDLRLARTERPVVELGLQGPRRARIAASLVTMGPASIRGPIAAAISRLQVNVTAGVRRGRWWIDAPVEIALDSLGHRDSAVVATDVTATVPLAWGPTPRDRGEGALRIAAVKWRRLALPGIVAHVRRQGDSYRLQGTAPIARRSSMSWSAEMVLGESRPHGVVEAIAPRFELDAGSPLHRLLVDVAGVRLTGTARLHARVPFGPGSDGGMASLRLAGGALTVVGGEKTVTGVRAEIALDSLLPLRTTGLQRIAWSSVAVGEHVLGRGSVRFRVSGADAIDVERAAIRTGSRTSSRAGAPCDGLLETGPFRVDPRAVDVRIPLRVEGVCLSRWLPVLTGNKVSGEGRLHGQVEVAVRKGRQWKVTPGTGTLRARGGGHFRVLDRETIENTLDRFASTEGSQLPDVRDRIVRSLSDFAYNQLAIELIEIRDESPAPSRTRSTIRVHTRGKGREVPQEIDLTVNITGVDDLLDTMLRPALHGWPGDER